MTTLSSSDDTELANKQKILNYIKNLTFSIVSNLIEGEETNATIKKLRKNPERFAQFVKTLSIVQFFVEHDQYATKRDIYYQYKHIYKREITLDSFLNELARDIRVPRTSLHIIASAKGLIAGDLQLIMKGGQMIDCRTSLFGTLVPSQVKEIENIESNAQFLLIVEKDATFQRLLADKLFLKFNCILITGKGVPDLSTRQLVNFLYSRLRIRCFCLTDANPYGLQIMCHYKYGSMVQSHDRLNLHLPTLEWIGLRITDLGTFFKDLNSENFLLRMSKADRQLAANLLIRFQDLHEFDLVKQLEFMIENNCKAELQHLQNISLNFLCSTYLTAKLFRLIDVNNCD